MTDNNWADYGDDLLNEMERDNRIGDHDWMVSENKDDGAWDDGSPRFRVVGVLLTAGRARCDLKWSAPPPAAVVKKEAASWTKARQRGVAKSIKIGKGLAEWYGKAVKDLSPGDVVRVKTGKTKVDKITGKGGFIEVQVILPKDQVGKSSIEAAKAASDIPF